MQDLTTLDIITLSNTLKNKEISALELTQAYLQKIAIVDIYVNAFLSVNCDSALQKAEEIDQKTEFKSPIYGIPYSVKDNLCTINIKTTCASKILQDFVPCYDATAVSMLKSSGGIMLGKTNLDEFGIGGSTENSAFKTTKNPLDTSLVPGGSSGGSAASVKANMCAFSIGTDTGGSIRQPAAFCGVVGIKPTYGLISRHGLISFASSLDTVGVITKTVADSAIVLEQICGHDSMDSTSIKSFYDKSFTSEMNKSIRGMTIGLPKELLCIPTDPAIKLAVTQAANAFESMGANVIEVSMPSLDHALAVYYIISSAEASSNLSRFDGVRYTKRTDNFSDIESLYINTRSKLLGKEVKRRIAIGTYVLSSGYYDEYYAKAQKVRHLICQDYKNAFEKCQILLCPTTPTLAYKIGSNIKSQSLMYNGDIFTVGASLAGVPALSMPYSSSNSLPIGIQLTANHLCEKTLYRAAHALEQYAKEDEK